MLCRPSIHANRSRRASALAAWTRWWTRSTFRGWKKRPIGALSRRRPLRLMEGVIPAAARVFRHGSHACWLPLLRVTDQPRGRRLPLDGHPERLQRDRGVQRLAHGPSHDLAGVQIEDCGEDQPALAGAHVGQIAEPHRVRGRRLEAAPDRVGRDRAVVPAVGGAHPARQGRQAPQPGAPHRPGHPVAADPAADGAQRSMDARRAPYGPPLSAWTTPMVSSRARSARLLALPGRDRRAWSPLTDTPSTRPRMEIGQTPLCSSTNPNPTGRPPEDERGLLRNAALHAGPIQPALRPGVLGRQLGRRGAG